MLTTVYGMDPMQVVISNDYKISLYQNWNKTHNIPNYVETHFSWMLKNDWLLIC